MASLAHLHSPGISALVPQLPGFSALDDRVRHGDAAGSVLVRFSGDRDAEVAALARHIERRGLSAGRRVVRAGALVESVWRDVALRFGLALPHEPEDAARALAHVAGSERAMVIACIDGARSWDRAVTRALSQHESPALIVLLARADAEEAELARASVFDVGSRLDADGLARWWEAVADERSGHDDADLAVLDAWVDRASRAERALPKRADLPEASRRLLHCLVLAGRAWPVAQVSELADPGALASLAAEGLVEARDGLVAPTFAEGVEATPADAAWVGRALTACFPRDSWALTRAAELWAGAGRGREAEEIMQRALRLADDGGSRAELWARWRAAVESWPADVAAAARLRGAELALGLGDVDVALEWAQRASAAEPKARGAFLLGRAALARGDLVAAEAALARARDHAGESEERWAAIMQIAEVRYAGGDLGAAAALAAEVLGQAEAASVRLLARNLLGKLLLARSEWVAADAHFAADE